MERFYKYLPFAITIMLIIIACLYADSTKAQREHNKILRSMISQVMQQNGTLSHDWLEVQKNLSSYMALMEKRVLEIEELQNHIEKWNKRNEKVSVPKKSVSAIER